MEADCKSGRTRLLYGGIVTAVLFRMKDICTPSSAAPRGGVPPTGSAIVPPVAGEAACAVKAAMYSDAVSETWVASAAAMVARRWQGGQECTYLL